MTPESTGFKKHIQQAYHFLQTGNLQQAAKITESLHAQAPDNIEVIVLIAEVNFTLKNFDAGVALLQKAASTHPQLPRVWARLGYGYVKINAMQDAAKALQKSIDLDPNQLDAQLMLATVYHHLGNWENAAPIYEEYADKFKSPDVFCEAGYGYYNHNQYKKAENFFRSAIDTDAEFWRASAGLARALFQRLNSELDIKESIIEEIYKLCERVKANTTFVDQKTEAIFTQANLLSLEGKFDRAISGYKQVLAVEPEHARATINLSLILLLQGNLREGWPLYRKRIDIKSENTGIEVVTYGNAKIPEWNGEPLEGKTLLVTGEQGIGDQVLHAQMVSKLQALQANIILTCHTKLTKLFERSFPDLTIWPKTLPLTPDLLSKTDYQCSLIDVAYILGIDLDTYQGPGSYLVADTGLVADFKERYEALSPLPKVGVAWHSQADNGARKSVPYEELVPILKNPKFKFISTQYNVAKEDIAKLNETYGTSLYVDESFNPYKDVDKAAAQIANLDLIITISNASVHLAGSLGKPVWLMVHTAPIWHWLANTPTSPWYPSIEIFRQQKLLNWKPVIESLTERLNSVTIKGDTIQIDQVSVATSGQTRAEP